MIDKRHVIFFTALAIGIALMMLLNGCQNVEYKEYDELGQLKKHYVRTGFVNWSDGEGKILPFGQVSINGIGIE